jgi:hydrogenase nickel incorporation protein HypA/HybF
MHELSITQNMVELAIDEGKKAGAKKIARISLLIGDMSGVVDESVRFYFGFISKDTIAEGAMLEIKRIPTTSRCNDCNSEFTPSEFDWSCPKCKGSNVKIIAGDELRVESIEVD